MTSKIAVIFDFDDTLAPDSTSAYLQSLGVDIQNFWREKVQALIQEAWDPVPAYLFQMIHESQSGLIDPITRASLESWGSQVSFYPQASTIFERLRSLAAKLNPDVQLHFYLISSGISDILRHTPIAHHFTDIWACDFHYDQNQQIAFPKKIVSFTDKTRYIFQIAKGIVGEAFRNQPFAVNRKISPSELRIPFNQMIFVGDGYTDIPCFSLVRKAGGVAIGVYDNDDREKWGRAWGFIEDERVSNLVPADYSKKSALSNSLAMALESMIGRMKHQGLAG